MAGMVWRLKVTPEKQADFERLTSQLVRDVAANEPDSTFEYRRSVEDPLTYVLFLSFDDADSFQRYSTADYHMGRRRRSWSAWRSRRSETSSSASRRGRQPRGRRCVRRRRRG